MREPVGIIGAGAFGLALARTLALAGAPVSVHVPGFEAARLLAEKRVSDKLPGVQLPDGVTVESDLAAVARRTRFMVLAVRAGRVEEVVEELGQVVDGGHMVMHALGALGTVRVSEMLRARTCLRQIGVLAGPALPGDLLAGRPCGLVAASPYLGVLKQARALLGVPPALRVYESRELAGVELAAALSGAMAVAIGIADGIGLGEGARALGITRAVAEMARLGAAQGVPERVFSGVAGLGNLLVRTSTSSGAHSEDYQFGLAVARAGRYAGDRPPAGAEAARAGAKLARKLKVLAPLCGLVEAILGGEAVPAAVERTMATLPELE